MKYTSRWGMLVPLLVCASAASSLVSATAAESNSKVRVLVVYGGHPFDTNQFWQVFKENTKISFRTVQYPEAEVWFDAAHAKEYDVLVFYDMWQKMSQEGKSHLLDRLHEGKGLVALHHCLASFPDWDEYARIIGGRYHLQKWQANGVEKQGSTYLHDVDFAVHVADHDHPVTRGISDFKIHDETYGGFEVLPESHVLLTTDTPTSGPSIAWSKNYGAARVVYLQLGHDHQAYENPNYRRLVEQAIDWVKQP